MAIPPKHQVSRRRKSARTAGIVLAVAALALIVGATRVCSSLPEAPPATSRAPATTSAGGSFSATGNISTTTRMTSTAITTPLLTSTTTAIDQSGPAGGAAQVLDVIDGDTLVADIPGVGEERVRLIGIDAPESGERFYAEAKEALEHLIQGGEVGLEMDAEERDRYGRLLAYVWTGKLLVNAELLRLGVATLFTVPPNVKHLAELEAAQQEAQAAARGVWGAPGDSPVKIMEVNYNAPGNDNFNLNEEYVVFEVLVAGTLLGYSVEDEAGHRYRFPDLVFQKGDVFKLHSGKGKNTRTDLYWGATESAIWNNSGDTVKVLDPQDRIVESYSY